MADINGFLKIKRKDAGNRPVHERICDHSEIEQILNSEDRMLQASRCMDCGIPFCHWGCPLDNLIPEWNDLLYKGEWREAYSRLASTNNFPEFTGRLCPAPCEHACVLNAGFDPVTIRENEVAIAEKAFSEGYIKPEPPKKRIEKKVAVIGSGPAGLAAADLLNRAGYYVTVFEKNDKAGGLLRYGIPDFKLSKTTVDRRIDLLIKEGITFRTGVTAGSDITIDELDSSFDAICLTIGSSMPRDLPVNGRELPGIHYAMEFLTNQNLINSGRLQPSENRCSAEGRKVVIIGGGDTGSDCAGTAIRQKALSVTQIEILPQPPVYRASGNPWPYYSRTLKTTTSHEEGCTRYWNISTIAFTGNERVNGLEVQDVLWRSENGKMIMEPVPGTARYIEADMVLIALGFIHPETEELGLGLDLDARKNIRVDSEWRTSNKKVFAAGDAVTGASLIVNAIASGRKAASKIIDFLES